jgi:cation diffusion facilitator family transporter
VETLASLGVVILLAASGIWIAYEGLIQIIKPSAIELGVSGFVVVVISIVANEIMARYKIMIGERENSLVLISDGKHSRADVISSVGVLAGLFVIAFFPMADGIIALIIGLYVLYESFDLGREAADQLIGVNDQDLETNIAEIFQEKDIDISSLKTRRLGSASFAELTVKLDPMLTVDRAERITKDLEAELLNRISRLHYVVIQVASHDYSQGTYRAGFGRLKGWQRGWQKEKEEFSVPPKAGYRYMLPVQEGKLYPEFGAPEYLVIDKKEGLIVLEKIIVNSYFDQEKGRGMRLLKAIEPDELVTVNIGEAARVNAEKQGAKVTLVDKNYDIARIRVSDDSGN